MPLPQIGTSVFVATRRTHLGYTFSSCDSLKTGLAYLGTVPAKKRVKRICEAISSELGRDKALLDHARVVKKLNHIMNGCANYFCLGPV